jgi:hypothetical protein
VARNSFVGRGATSRIGPSSADAQVAAPHSSVSALDLACTTVEPSGAQQDLRSVMAGGRVDLVAEPVAVDREHRHCESGAGV